MFQEMKDFVLTLAENPDNGNCSKTPGN